MQWKLQRREDLTLDYFKEHFSYDSLTGDMRRIKRYYSKGTHGTCDILLREFNNRGYYWVNIRGLYFLVHRLAWFCMSGEHPDGEIDHINGDRKDNRWENLRLVTAFENSRNQGERKDNTSGCRGVTKNGVGWAVRISQNGVRYHLGTYRDKAEAIAVRKQAEKDLNYHPNHAKRESWKYEN